MSKKQLSRTNPEAREKHGADRSALIEAVKGLKSASCHDCAGTLPRRRRGEGGKSAGLTNGEALAEAVAE
jgi:hypothetical protein